MRHARFSILSLLSCFVIVACSENPADLKRLEAFKRAAVVTPTQTLDQSVRELLALFPKSLDTRDPESEGPDLNPRATWDQITKKYASGRSKPAHMAIAKRKVVRLSDWVSRNTPLMNAPPAPETKPAAASRLVLYMNLYVFGGPTTTPPPFIPGADAAVGVVTPDAPATIVTPTSHAGVQFEAGSVDESTVIVITQNPTLFRANCSGPLTTRLCQYPQFYTFSEFPEKALLKGAKINVCHVNSGEERRPLADHDRFRLAHTRPANPDDYIEGSTIRSGAGENIEILPLVEQTFSTCEETSYGTEQVGSAPMRLLSRVASGFRRLVTPKAAYAVDLGLGGIVKRFSPFNIVDPESAPDFAVESFTIGEGPHPLGSNLLIGYGVRNIGTATGRGVPFSIVLSVREEELVIGTGSIESLVPGGIVAGPNSALIPTTLDPGRYAIRFLLGSNESFPDPNGENDAVTSTVAIGSEVWHVSESGGWNASWSRRGLSNIFDGVWRPVQGEGLTTATMTFTRDGRSVDFLRTQSSDGRACHYVGTLSADGLTASGTETCPGVPGVFSWTASIGVE